MLKQQNVDAGVLAIGNQVQAEVFDKDLDYGGSAAGQLSVVESNGDTSDERGDSSVDVLLTETDISSARFGPCPARYYQRQAG